MAGSSFTFIVTQTSKELLTQQLAKDNAVRQGAVALFACVEPCLSFQIRGDRQAKRLRLVLSTPNAHIFYHYYLHPEFGLLDHQLQCDWPALLQKLLVLAHPLQEEIAGAMRGLSYY